MEFKSNNIVLLNQFGSCRLLIDADLTPEEMNKFSKQRSWKVSIVDWREKRSLNANAYLWVLIGQIADVLKSTKDEVYMEMLQRYGQSIVVTVDTIEGADQLVRTYKLCKNLGAVKVNGRAGIQVLCLIGSSQYNTREMAVLIDGVVSEAMGLGISVKPAEELDVIKQTWGV